MSWTLGGTKIIVTDGNEEANQIVARVQPLDGGTVNQIFGYESPTRKISCYIVGDTNKAAIQAMTTAGTTKALVSSTFGDLGDFIVEKVSFTMQNIISQTLDLTGALTCESPVYLAEITLLED
jgi:hypothetical protein